MGSPEVFGANSVALAACVPPSNGLARRALVDAIKENSKTRATRIESCGPAVVMLIVEAQETPVGTTLGYPFFLQYIALHPHLSHDGLAAHGVLADLRSSCLHRDPGVSQRCVRARSRISLGVSGQLGGTLGNPSK